MKKYTRIPVEVEAVVFQEGQGIEDGFMVYETEYPEDGHCGIDSDTCDTTRHTILSAAIYNRGEFIEIHPGDYLVITNGEKSVWKKEKFEKEYSLN